MVAGEEGQLYAASPPVSWCGRARFGRGRPQTEGQARLIRFEDVAARYGQGPDVLSGLSFELAPGSFHFLTGPSGAGKSTVLRLLYLAIKPVRGSIKLFDRDVVDISRRELPTIRRRIGVV